MTSYNFDTPEWLWEAYKSTVPQSETLDEPLHEHMAERVADHPLADEEDRRRAEQFLNGGDPR